MSTDTTEKGLEQHITQYLTLVNGYQEGIAKDFSRTDCVDGNLLFQFLETTQPVALEKLKKAYQDNYKQKIIYRINTQIKQLGIIEVLRKGITDYNVKLKLFYKKPVSIINEKDNKKLVKTNKKFGLI